MSAEETGEEEPEKSGRTVGVGVRRPGENAVAREERRARKRRRKLIRTALDEAYERLAVGEYRTAGRILRERVAPALDVDGMEIDIADPTLQPAPVPWRPVSLEALVEDADRYLAAAPDSQRDMVSGDRDTAVAWAEGGMTPAETAMSIVRDAALSLESMAIGRDILDAELTRSSIVRGHATTLGAHHQQWEMNVSDPVFATNDDRPVPVNLVIGQRGSGKSTFVATEVIDRYQAGHKILDLHDQKKLESGVYDIDQQQKVLRSVRRRLGLPEDFSEADDLERPDVEFYVPIHTGLKRKQILYDANGEAVVKPFAIDPATIPKRIFDAWVGSTTTKERQELNRAHSAMPQAGWTLQALAENIQDGEADPRVKEGLTSRLEGLQKSGWVRDDESAYLLDWADIFRDTDTITCFSTSLMDDQRDKMRVLLFLISAMLHERDRQTEEFPRACAVLRELHHVAPVQTNRKEDPVEKRLQKIAASEMREFASEGRHVDVEILADTQHWGQVAKRLREHVTRVAMFNLQFAAARSVFEEVRGQPMNKWVRTVTRQETGECTIIADNGRIHGDGQTWEFLQPVQAAAPPCHQIDTDHEGSGWTVRAKYLDEELDTPPDSWRIDVPRRLAFQVEGNADDAEDKGFREFVRRCAVTGEEQRCEKDLLLEAYDQFARAKGYDQAGSKHTLVNLAKSVIGEPPFEAGMNTKMRIDGGRVMAYRGVALNEIGASYADVRPSNPSVVADGED